MCFVFLDYANTNTLIFLKKYMGFALTYTPLNFVVNPDHPLHPDFQINLRVIF